jgi:hypothetical protein
MCICNEQGGIKKAGSPIYRQGETLKPTRLSFQRKLDHQSEELMEKIRDTLLDHRANALAMHKRLVQLDGDHYFDPKEKRMLGRNGKAVHCFPPVALLTAGVRLA